MTTDRMSSAYQRSVSDFVQREVVLCVSTFVYELANLDLPSEAAEPIYDLRTGTPDYEVAARDAGWVPVPGGGFRDPDTGERSQAVSWEELCAEHDIETDDYRPEVFEHWVVSTWLADRLRAHGETVIDDLMGLGPIWGRTTTGQSIALDGVICDIYDERFGIAC